MIDYLIVFPTPESRAAAYPTPESNPPTWGQGGRSIMPTSILISDATYDGEGNLATSAIFGNGSWLVIRTAERDAKIEAMPNCMLATDGDLAAAGEPFVHFCRLQPETIIGQVSPVFAGDAYVIPAGQPASVLDQWLIAE